MKKIMLFLLTILSLSFANIPNECDILAAYPNNESNPSGVKGVTFDNIDGEKAVKACIKAVKDFPDEPRYSYQLGRAYDKIKDAKKAFKWNMKAAEQGHAYAQSNICIKYSFGQGVEKNYIESLKWCMKAAEQNQVVAQFRIGDMYVNGQGVEKNDKEAFKWIMKAAKQGNANAQYRLANMYGEGKGIKENIKDAFKWINKAAEQGHSEAQYILGNVYYDGHEEIKNDYKEAIKWYRKAAEQGHAKAQHRLAKMYNNGKGVEKDYKEAIKWYRKAAEQGNVKSLRSVVWMYYLKTEIHEKETLQWIIKFAENSDSFVQNSLGDIYYEGNGVKKDYKEAFKWYMKAAEKGHDGAQYSIGWMYRHGQWATKNYTKAFRWYMKAVEQDNKYAQNQIGRMYFFGESVKKNTKEALSWYRKAAENGSVEATETIGTLYYLGKSVRKDYKKSLKWFMKAAKKGAFYAQSMIGYAYYDGTGVRKNYIKAYSWLNLALSSDNISDTERESALRAFDKLERKMTPQQIAIAQSYDPLKENIEPKDRSDNRSIESSERYTGTGFFIGKSKILTNNHVVNNCKSIELIRRGYKSTAKITAKDSINDLAILEADKTNSSSLNFRAGKGIRIGNDIIVIGYPLGDLLGSGIKLTTGNVSALTGLVNDTRMLQLTAPVQPGNSGGALLDESGNVVGIIVARLQKEQNVNLAIKSNVAQMFLDINNIDYGVAISKEKKAVADIADESKESIVQVVCYQ